MSFWKNMWNETKDFLVGAPNVFGSSLIPHLSSGVGNIIFGETLEDKQRYALEQMAKQNEYNVDNYKMQRDDQLRFTDPSFIRERLERAGLSPSLALQNGAFSSGLSTSIGSSSTAGGLSSSLHPSAPVNVAESVARIRNINQDTENKKTENDYNRESMQYRLSILSNEKTAGIFRNEISRIDSLYREQINKATIDKIQTEIDTMAGNLANAKNLTEIERQRVQGYLDSITGQLALWKAQIGLTEAQTTTEGTKQDVNKSTVSLNESLQRLNNANAWSKEFENFKWQNNGTIKPGMNVLQGVMALIADLPSNISKTFKDIQSIGAYIDEQFFNLKDIIIKDVDSFIKDVNFIATSTNKLDSFLRILEKNVGKFTDNK